MSTPLEDKLRGNWNKIKGDLKERYGELTDDDLTYEEGRLDQLVGRIQHKIGKSKEEVRSMLNQLSTT